MSRLSVALIASALVACGGSSKYDQQQTQVAITPKGLIVGRVTENATASPVSGVTVSALVGGATVTATTDDNGLYVIKDVVVSSTVTMMFEKEGYLRSISSTSIPSYAGNAPLAGGQATLNVRMSKGDGTLSGILTLPNGLPAAGATMYVDQRNAGYDSIVTATTDMAGAFKMTGLATAPTGLSQTVYAQWFDENADGQADYQPTSTGFTLYTGNATARVFMRYSNIGQRVVSSNVFSGQIAATDALKFTFAFPVMQSGTNGNVARQFTLTNNQFGSDVEVEQTWASSTEVTVKPTAALREGEIYYVNINVLNVSGGGFSTQYQFQVRGSGQTGPTKPVANLTVTNDGTYPQPNKFDYDFNDFVVSFDALDGINNYWVFAKDTTFNQSFIRVATPSVGVGTGRIKFNLSLPYAFNFGQPLSAGNKVTFAVVPVDLYGNAGPVASSPTVTVSDNVAPSTQAGTLQPVLTPVNANNKDGTAARQIQLQMRYSEPMDPSTAPVLTSSSGTIPQTFTWNQGTFSGVLTLTIGAGVDATGTFTIRGGKDAAGNAISGADFNGYLGGAKELIVNGGFEDAAGACSLTGWSQSQTGGMPAGNAVAGSGVPQVGRCAALIGAPQGAAPATGLAKLTQDIVLPGTMNTPAQKFVLRWAVRPSFYNVSGQPVSILPQLCRITDTSDALLFPMYSGDQSSSTNYTTGSTNFTPPTLNQTTVRVACSVDNTAASAPAVNAALYIDDLSLTLVTDSVFNN